MSSSPQSRQILIADDRADVLKYLLLGLGAAGWSVRVEADVERTLAALESVVFDLLLIDLRIPLGRGPLSAGLGSSMGVVSADGLGAPAPQGLVLYRYVRTTYPGLRCAFLTAVPEDLLLHTDLVSAGEADVLNKADSVSDLVQQVGRLGE